MMGIKERRFDPLPRDVSLEDLVPAYDLYRRLEERVDLSFVRDLVVDRYAAVGRPSVDPVVFFKLQIVLFCEDLRSERQLMGVVADRLRAFAGTSATTCTNPCRITRPSPGSASATALRSSGPSSRG